MTFENFQKDIRKKKDTKSLQKDNKLAQAVQKELPFFLMNQSHQRSADAANTPPTVKAIRKLRRDGGWRADHGMYPVYGRQIVCISIRAAHCPFDGYGRKIDGCIRYG